MNGMLHMGQHRPGLDARIAAHVQAWAKIRATATRPQEHFPFITISRQFGCEGAELARQLVETLNERCRPSIPWVAYDHELLDQVAKELHLSRAVVESLDGQRRSEMSELFDAILNRKVDEAVVYRKLAEVVRSLALHGHAVLVGRGTALTTQDLRNGLHVRLVAPFEWRAHKLTESRGLARAEARKLAAEGEEQRQRFIHTFFVHDPGFEIQPELTLDNSRFNLLQLTEIVFTALSVRFGETLVGA
jgi:cytidylate kinase